MYGLMGNVSHFTPNQDVTWQRMSNQEFQPQRVTCQDTMAGGQCGYLKNHKINAENIIKNNCTVYGTCNFCNCTDIHIV